MQAGYPGTGPLSTMTIEAAPTGGSTVTTTSDIPTGVFTATSTPSSTKNSAALPRKIVETWLLLLELLVILASTK